MVRTHCTCISSHVKTKPDVAPTHARNNKRTRLKRHSFYLKSLRARAAFSSGRSARAQAFPSRLPTKLDVVHNSHASTKLFNASLRAVGSRSTASGTRLVARCSSVETARMCAVLDWRDGETVRCARAVGPRDGALCSSSGAARQCAVLERRGRGTLRATLGEGKGTAEASTGMKVCAPSTG